MRDILKMTNELQASFSAEMDALLTERTAMRDVLEARLKELGDRRDQELVRIQQWADQQKALVQEVFGALIGETRADLENNSSLMVRLGGDAAPMMRSGSKPRLVSKSSTAFAKAAE